MDRPTDCRAGVSCLAGSGDRAAALTLTSHEERSSTMLTRFSIDDSSHNRDGLVVQAWDGNQRIDAFISRHVMDEWVEPIAPPGRRRSLYRQQYNELGQRNLSTIGRIVATKYERGASFNRQHPYIEILTSDIIESGGIVDQSRLIRDPLPPAFVSAAPSRS
jgi:hypothetical protein